MAADDLLAAIRRHDCDAFARDTVGDEAQQLGARFAAPMHVLQDQKERPSPRDRPVRARKRLEQTRPFFVRTQARERLDVHARCKLRNDRGQRAEPDRFEVCAQQQRDRGAQGVAKCLVRITFGSGCRTDQDATALLFGAQREFGGEARLADSGLTADEADPACSARGSIPKEGGAFERRFAARRG